MNLDLVAARLKAMGITLALPGGPYEKMRAALDRDCVVKLEAAARTEAYNAQLVAHLPPVDFRDAMSALALRAGLKPASEPTRTKRETYGLPAYQRGSNYTPPKKRRKRK